MEQALVVVERNTDFSVDSRQMAKELGIAHRSFFKMITTYQQEIEEDFGLVRFEITKTTADEKGRGRTSKYALLTEDQTFAYLAYSQNTEQARQCKRKLVKAFSLAREIIHTFKICPSADLENLSLHQVRLVGLVGKMVDLANEGEPYNHLIPHVHKEAQAIPEEDLPWGSSAQPVKLLK